MFYLGIIELPTHLARFDRHYSRLGYVLTGNNQLWPWYFLLWWLYARARANTHTHIYIYIYIYIYYFRYYGKRSKIELSHTAPQIRELTRHVFKGIVWKANPTPAAQPHWQVYAFTMLSIRGHTNIQIHILNILMARPASARTRVHMFFIDWDSGQTHVVRRRD